MGNVIKEFGLGKYKIIPKGENVRGYVLKKKHGNSVVCVRRLRGEDGKGCVDIELYFIPHANLDRDDDMKTCILMIRRKIEPSRAIIYVER